jgi:hypothetical protein
MVVDQSIDMGHGTSVTGPLCNLLIQHRVISLQGSFCLFKKTNPIYTWIHTQREGETKDKSRVKREDKG